MVHQRQRLSLGLEAPDHLAGVHPRFDDLQRHRALNGPRLLGHEHDAHPAFADLLEQLVRADSHVGVFDDRPIHGRTAADAR